MIRILVIALTAMALSAYAAPPGPDKKQDTRPAVAKDAKPEIKLSDIPGITTPDRTPHACVDCHANHPEMKMDFRLTTVLAKWHTAGADSGILEKARAAAPEGRIPTGKHPDIQALVKVIPDDCFMCHVRDSRVAPPFTKLLHEIHLVGGKDNHFLTKANGACTSCHKLDEKTGMWHLGSGVEK
jgi:hypothetical protein